MAKKIEIKLRIKMKWWFKYLYLPGLNLIYWFVINCINIEAEPNEKKFKYWTEKGIKFELIE